MPACRPSRAITGCKLRLGDPSQEVPGFGLVGSEMCIRDRYSTFFSTGHTLRWFPGITSIWLFPIIVFPRNPNAVSYTHLTLPTICSV